MTQIGAVGIGRPEGHERILVAFDFGLGLGDLVCCEPMVRGLRETHPSAEIRYSGSAGNTAYSPAFDGPADADYCPTQTFRVPVFRNVPSEHYAKLEALPYLVDQMLSFTGCLPADKSPRLNLVEQDCRDLESVGFDDLPRPLVAICADQPDIYRGWPLDRYRSLAEHLITRGATVVDVGWRDRVGAGIDLVSMLPVRQAATMISKCDFYIGNSSGLLQYAQAARVPSLGLFSSALPQRFVHDRRLVIAAQARELPCINCMTRDFAARQDRACDTEPPARCMQDLSLTTVQTLVDQFFDEYLVDCPLPGAEGIRAQRYRMRNYAWHTRELLRLGYPNRAADWVRFAAELCGAKIEFVETAT